MITYLYCRYLIDNCLQKGQKILIIINRKDLVKQTANSFTEFDSLNDVPMIVETIFSGSKRLLDANVVIGA